VEIDEVKIVHATVISSEYAEENCKETLNLKVRRQQLIISQIEANIALGENRSSQVTSI
jgi:hypothetical protein